MLRPRHTTLLLALLLVAALTAIGLWQAHTTAKLREDVAALRAARATPLAAAPAAPTSTPAAEPEPEAPAAVTTWQAEVEKLRREVAEAEASATSDAARRPAGNRTNRGGASAFDAFETILWAATGGEVAELEKWIAFSPDAADAAAQFLAALSPEMRAEFPDARRLIATMMASRLPLNIEEAKLLESRTLDSGETSLRLLVTRAGTTAAPRELQLRFQSSATGSQLLVPREVIEGYQHLLTGTLPKRAGPNASANPVTKPTP